MTVILGTVQFATIVAKDGVHNPLETVLHKGQMEQPPQVERGIVQMDEESGESNERHNEQRTENDAILYTESSPDQLANALSDQRYQEAHDNEQRESVRLQRLGCHPECDHCVD